MSDESTSPTADRASGARPRAGSALLGILAAGSLAIGAYGALAPHSFYLNVFGVDLLGPYNEHLVTDVGGFYLGFGAIWAWAALRPARDLVRAVCAGWLLAQLLHFGYHATHLADFGAGEAIAQTALLAFSLALPVAALALVERGAAPSG